MILYTRNVCPACDTLKRMLAADRSIPRPREVNIDQDPDGLRRVQQLGVHGVPALEMRGKAYVGVPQILAALRSG